MKTRVCGVWDAATEGQLEQRQVVSRNMAEIASLLGHLIEGQEAQARLTKTILSRIRSTDTDSALCAANASLRMPAVPLLFHYILSCESL